MKYGVALHEKNRELRVCKLALVAGAAALAITGCTTESGNAPEKVATVQHARINRDYDIQCAQIAQGVMLDCVASVPGAYSLYKGSYEDPSNKPLVTYVVQAPHDHFSLIPQHLPVANCTKGYVTLEPAAEKAASQPGYQVYSFDIC